MKMNCLLKYISAGNAEAELSLLGSIFVRQDEFQDFVLPESGNIRIIVGKKGTGKSAILLYNNILLKANSIRSYIVRPDDLDVSFDSSDTSVGYYKRKCYTSLVSSLAKKVGGDLSGLLNSEEKFLHDYAVQEGEKEADRVEKSARLMSKLAKTLLGVEFSLPSASDSFPVDGLRRALKANVESSEGAVFLLFDDIDQIASLSHSGHINRIWGLLLALRKLAMEVPKMRIIVTIREEVWRRIKRDNAGQTDQVDHFETCVKDLYMSRVRVQKIIEHRLSLAARDYFNRPEVGDCFNVFFENDGAIIPTTNERRSWSDIITVRCRERARDAIVFMNLLATSAKNSNRDKIAQVDLDNVSLSFSIERLTAMSTELSFDCPQFVNICESFINIDGDGFAFTAIAVREHLQRLPSHFSIQLYGRVMQPGSADACFSIWKFLYDVGFLNARISDQSKSKGYSHLLASEYPNIVIASNWPGMQQMLWEINPAYIDAIKEKQRIKRLATGLPFKRKSRKR